MEANRVKVKICGVSRKKDIQAAISEGADYIGMVFFPPSPRNVSFNRVRKLVPIAKEIIKVALTVDADDDFLEQIMEVMEPDMLQLHGSESPVRAAELRQKFGVKVMKAVGVREQSDIKNVKVFDGVVDQLLIDAKPIAGAKRPGGSGISFDWKILKQWKPSTPWMLAGGLNAGNVQKALELTHARQVDVSSGVETDLGIKSQKRIADFMHAVQEKR